MIRYLALEELLELHRLVVEQSGGASGLRDLAGLESAWAQPQMTFDAHDLYPTLAAKAGSLGYSLVCNHPFFDGNKGVGHAAMETFLILNGFELQADVNEQEQLIFSLAAGELTREALISWIEGHMQPYRKSSEQPDA